MRRRSTLILCSGLAMIFFALPLTAGAERRATRDVATVKVAFNKKLKKRILVNSRGFTLYLFTDDSRGKPTCFDDSTYHCSKAWPPLRATGAPVAGAGVNASLLATVKRADGDPQVMYNGHPLYTDAGAVSLGIKADRKPGDVNGQAFLQIWFVVSPSGKAIKKGK